MVGTILVTGFGTFPGVATNPSEALIERLRANPPELASPFHAVFCVLPVIWTMLEEDLPRLYATHAPDAIIHFGVAGRRRMISIETRARNIASTQRADAAGFCYPHKLLDPDGPRCRPATVPAGTLIEAVHKAGLPVRTSRDAGDYVCNATLWSSLAAGFASTFVHVPQVGERTSIGIDDLERVGRTIVEEVAGRLAR
ncbi:pyroglutamyl-peptidase [Breoghania corrubedonensis]|uniref:Pyrrolidone-carboxylate peptidase n=1 Tax=Breoghania corrubedonensis TaxID=665038 RepID=A0A2T5UW93_9HYPH|nr:peptidase C15 [Breoghania corrubedonensis]PTW55778.1 pyroglutamyl-peptidase [Breoghania corrubedonensis]